MKTCSILLVCLAGFVSCLRAEDYVMTINGVATEIDMGKEAVVALPDGTKLKVVVAPKQYVRYAGEFCSFEYYAGLKPEITKDNDGNATVTFADKKGASVVFRELKGPAKAGLVEATLKELTRQEAEYGYSKIERKVSQNVGGVVLGGRGALMTGSSRIKDYRVYEYRTPGGMVLISVGLDKADEEKAAEFLNRFWGTMKLKDQPKPGAR